MGRSKKSDSSLAMRLGSRIKGRRLQLHWTQEELASRLGVEVNTVSRMECGTHLPSLQRLESIALVLDVSVGSLLGAASPHPKDQAIRFHDILSGLSEAEREFVIDAAKRQSEFFKSGR